MTDFLNRIWYFAGRIIYWFINPGNRSVADNSLNTINIVIPKLITNYPILILFFGLSVCFLIIKIFRRLISL